MPAPLRILVLDGNARVSVGASFFRAFSSLGHDAHFLDNARWLGWWNPSILARAARRLAYPVAISAYNAYVVAQVARLRPDLLFVAKGFGLWARTIATVRRWVGVCVVFQNDDVRNPASTPRDILRAIPLWDVVFTPRHFAVEELLAVGARRVEHLRFGYDPLLSFPPPESDRDMSLADSAVFVGTGLAERIAPLEALARQIPVAIFGGLWQRVRTESPLRSVLHPAVFEGRLRAINAGAGVNVAFVAKANRDQHTMRTFEIPACGGFLLAERTSVHSELFREDEEAAFFGSTEELVKKAASYLANPDRRWRVAQAGCLRVTGRERYEDRAAQVLEVVRESLRMRERLT